MSSPRISWPEPPALGSISGQDSEPVYLINQEGHRVNARGRTEYAPVNLQLRYEWQAEGRLHYSYAPANPGDCVTATMLSIGRDPDDAARILSDLITTKSLTEIGTLNTRGGRFRVDLSEDGARRLYGFDDFVRAYLFTSEPKDAPRTRPQRLFMVSPKRGIAPAPSANVVGKVRAYPYTFAQDLAPMMDIDGAISEGRIIDAGILLPSGEYFLSEPVRRNFARLAVFNREGATEGHEDEIELLTAYDGPTPEEAIATWEAAKARTDLDEGFGLVTAAAKGKRGKTA